jgi:hypothetical protein
MRRHAELIGVDFDALQGRLRFALETDGGDRIMRGSLAAIAQRVADA